jgi:hypothetical protein
MSETTEHGSIRFYFSFRSPYAWIAAERLDSELGDLGVQIERVPIFPTPQLFPNDPSGMPDKVAYVLQDIPRLARQYGLTVGFPPAGDTDWSFRTPPFLGRNPRALASVSSWRCFASVSAKASTWETTSSSPTPPARRIWTPI